MDRSFSLLALLFIGVVGAARPQPAVFPVGHETEGLPTSPGPMAVYAPDPAAPLNRLHALLFMAERTPSEIGAALPEERRRGGLTDAAFFSGKWPLAQRRGPEITAEDARVFGGDVRTSPVAGWSPVQAAEARALLADLSTPARAAVAVPNRLARLSLQWDLLQVWWRFERAPGSVDDATLVALARAIQALALPRIELLALPTGLEWMESAGMEVQADRRRPRAPRGLLGGVDSTWVELDRAPAALFQAQRSLQSVRVFVRSTDRATVEQLVAQVPELGAKNQLVTIPRGTEVALLLAMVGVTPDLEPVATGVVSELRLRLAVAEDRLDAESDTSSRDGWSHWVWFFSRANAFVERGAVPLRFVPDTTQSLFLEYGTPKYSVYFAQCALCHRTTNGGNQNPSGVHVLGKHAKPAVLTDSGKRARDAEQQMGPVIETLRKRLAGSGG